MVIRYKAYLKCESRLAVRNRILIINWRFLQRLRKRSSGNQLIHRRLSRTKLIGSGSGSRDSGMQTVWWMVFGVETEREIGRSSGGSRGGPQGPGSPLQKYFLKIK